MPCVGCHFLAMQDQTPTDHGAGDHIRHSLREVGQSDLAEAIL